VKPKKTSSETFRKCFFAFYFAGNRAQNTMPNVYAKRLKKNV